MSEFLFALLIVLGVIYVPCVAFLVLALIERLSAPALNGRELAARGILEGLVTGKAVSTKGLRVITYPVTVVCFRDRGPYLVHDQLATDLPAGTHVALWRDLADDKFAIERSDQP